MLRNYIITAVRNLARNKANTAINVLGLTLGITCSLVLFLVIKYELSFNKHFADNDRMYRVITEYQEEEGKVVSRSMQFPFVTAFKTAYPDVPVTFVHNNMSDRSFYVTREGERIRYQESKNHMALVHPDYVDVFSHQWLSGNPETALDNINTVVITRKIAEKYFGTTDVVGQTSGYLNDKNLQVTGVIEDYPKTTDFPIDILISIETNQQYRNNKVDEWGGNYSQVNAYIKLPKGISQADMEARMLGFDQQYSGFEDTRRLLQPFSDLHYNSELGTYGRRTISKSSLWAIGTIGVLLLLAACINFVNLNTALAVRRSKEVGVRKVLGGSRRQLFNQFMGETTLITFLALLVSFGVTELALIQLDNQLGYDLSLGLFTEPLIPLFLSVVFIFCILFSGLYPAVMLSAYKPAEALKFKMSTKQSGKLSLRKVLVVTQLTISQALIICTLVIVGQMDYFYNAPMGLDSESVLEMRIPPGKALTQRRFKEQLLQIPGVESVSLTNNGAISTSRWVGPYTLTLNGERHNRPSTPVKFIDKDFLNTYGIQLLAGENIQEIDSLDQVLVNESLIAELGIDDPYEVIGQPMEFWSYKGLVVGVVSDYNTRSLHDSMEPLVMIYDKGFAFAALRFNTNETKALLSAVGNIYNETYPEKDFEPQFLDDTIASFYEEERKAASLFQMAAVVAIFIGCIGLIGLITYIASRKVKEVGVRKVLGASVANILMLFSRQFLSLTFLGFVIAAPLAWYVMQGWLQNYEYRIEMGVGVFAIGLVASVALVMLSTGFRAYLSASANPSKSLRSE